MKPWKRRVALGYDTTAATLLSAVLLTLAGSSGVVTSAHADCFTSDGTAREGTVVTWPGIPKDWPPVYGFDSAPVIGAHFDACNAAVRVSFSTGYSNDDIDDFNVSFGQRAQSDGPIAIFSGQRELAKTNSQRLFNTRPKPFPVYAFFRVQTCSKGFMSTSTCSAWSPNVTIDLGNNEMTEYS